jgi:ribosomal protein L37AE/L43A
MKKYKPSSLPLYCKHCDEEIIGINNKARIYYSLEDDSISEVYGIHEKCVNAHLGLTATEKGSGEWNCKHCHKSIRGLAIIDYTYEGHHVNESIFLHSECAKPYRLLQAGKVHKCPKCDGLGFFTVNNSVCKLCDGDGMLEKPAIPIDWKKSP